MAMLLLACDCLTDFDVATVDHGLRPEAAEECALVERVCTQKGVDCTTLTITVQPGNTQANARKARYAALGAWAAERGVAAILTAHHADDQAETLLMRLNRGSGLGGLAAIRASTMIAPCPVPVLRPLLAIRRIELAERLASSGITAAQDQSNLDETYDRVRVRKGLADAGWLDVVALARSARLLAEADATLTAIAESHWREALIGTEEVRVYTSELAEIDIRLLQRGIAHFTGEASPADIASLVSQKLTGPGMRANLGGVLIERIGQGYLLRREPPRRN